MNDDRVNKVPAHDPITAYGAEIENGDSYESDDIHNIHIKRGFWTKLHFVLCQWLV